MGRRAAHNIHQLMVKEMYDSEPEFLELAQFPPMIGIAVGKQAVAYGPEMGTSCGTELMERMFGDDLGRTSRSTWSFQLRILIFAVVHDHLQLDAVFP